MNKNVQITREDLKLLRKRLPKNAALKIVNILAKEGIKATTDSVNSTLYGRWLYNSMTNKNPNSDHLRVAYQLAIDHQKELEKINELKEKLAEYENSTD